MSVKNFLVTMLRSSVFVAKTKLQDVYIQIELNKFPVYLQETSRIHFKKFSVGFCLFCSFSWQLLDSVANPWDITVILLTLQWNLPSVRNYVASS